MAFVDEITLRVKAGRGGDGVVRWLHEKGKEYSGPAGGNGGKGGDVYAVAVRDIARLAGYRHAPKVVAEDGGAGESKGKHGADGRDAEAEVPVGSLITITRGARQERVYELLREGEQVKLLMGGRGGLGNKHFKGSHNTRPKQFTPGKDGEEAEAHVELRMIADAGLVGLPNAGKSSLLNAVTAARAKVGAYAFTTLEPNLGELHGYLLADIPGLIEGAHEGKGLGAKFLRHIARTKVLLHCISLEERSPLTAYDTVRREVSASSRALVEKPEYIVLTKADTRTLPEIQETKRLLTERNPRILTVSVFDEPLLAAFRRELLAALKSVYTVSHE